MSAAVCGSKRSFFEDLPTTPNSSSPAAKKLRCSSPIRFSPFSHSPTPSLLDQLRNMFPYVDDQLFVRALEVCGDDLSSAIKSLNELRLGSEKLTSLNDSNANIEKGCEDPSAPRSLPVGGAEWVELFVSEMMKATSVEDARARASKVLESIEKSISARSGAEAEQVRSFDP